MVPPEGTITLAATPGEVLSLRTIRRFGATTQRAFVRLHDVMRNQLFMTRISVTKPVLTRWRWLSHWRLRGWAKKLFQRFCLATSAVADLSTFSRNAGRRGCIALTFT